MIKITLGIAFLFLMNNLSFAQIFSTKNYPQNYFGWPVNAKKGLVANFGELRPNHYHMGLDCRTDQQENRPVLAAAAGYIAKVKIEPSGFGRCIYINHPNGLTTLYAHLNDFYPALEKYITEQQYKLQSWKIFIDVPEGLFTVEKGQVIANSGNTGGSQGPHVHFEIRDTKTDKVLNPLLFGFPIADNIPPDILRLAVYNRRISTYEQSPTFYTLKKINGAYTTVPALLLLNTDMVSFAITAYDRYTGSTNKNGIYQAILFENAQPVVGFQLDNIGYDETRYLNAHIDYKLRSTGGSYVQHLSRLPGYPVGVYKQASGDGIINLGDENVHTIKIEVKDAEGNSTNLNFGVQKRVGKVVSENQILSVVKEGIKFYPQFINVFENSNVNFYLPENALYDAVTFKYNEIMPNMGNTIYQLHNGSVPVHVMFSVKIKNPGIARSDKMVMHRFSNGKDDYVKANPIKLGNEDDWYQASFRAFGSFQLMIDNTPPTIIAIGLKEGMNAAKLSRIAFVIKDNTKELYNFAAYLDGKWLRFTNDKGSAFIYKFDEHCTPGLHELKLSVADCVGNIAERSYHFTR